jgi:Putative GTPase activating protein for Arf
MLNALTVDRQSLSGHRSILAYSFVSDAQVYTYVGIHREFGRSVTQVRSTVLDRWTKEQISWFQTTNNEQANMHWEFQFPSNEIKSSLTTNDANAKVFITNKYINKQYARQCVDPYVVYRNDNAKTDKSIDMKIEEESKINNIRNSLIRSHNIDKNHGFLFRTITKISQLRKQANYQ